MSITSPTQNYFTDYIINSQLNGGGTSFIMDFIKIYIVLCIILGITLIWTYVMLYKVFEKLGIKGWKALIPFYNYWLFLEKMGLPPILGVIPGIQGIAMLIAYYKYGQSLGKSKLFSILLAILPPIMLTIIVFSKDKNTSTNTYEKNENAPLQLNSYEQNINENNNTNIQQLMQEEKDENLYYQQNIAQRQQPNLNQTPQSNATANYGTKQIEQQVQQQSINSNPQYNTINTQPQLQNNRENEFVKCKRCGTNIKKGNKLCFICGTPVE